MYPHGTPTPANHSCVQHKACFAQLLDQKRKFLEAAGRYMDLLRLSSGHAVEEGELKIILEKAIKCAILAPAGPQRQRVLGMLIRDEHVGLVLVRASLPPVFHSVYFTHTRTRTCCSR